MSNLGFRCFSALIPGLLFVAAPGLFRIQGDTEGDEEAVSPETSVAARAADSTEVEKPSREEARKRSEMLHELIHQMLPAVHEDYYREDEGLPLPAAMFGRVFEKFAERQPVRIRWLAVDGEPMNVDHRPRNEFEHAAVKALKSGQSVWEETTEGQYSYAGAIRLTSECLKCHVPNRTSTRERTAGIVISMPVASPPNDID
jgi:hypothetical protein